MSLEIARLYDVLGSDPSGKFLIDRLWPRGLRKDSAPFEGWLKDIAPSPDLRRWYSHEVEKYDEFARRYRDELSGAEAEPLLSMLRTRSAAADVVLLTATKDLEHSSAAVLRDVLTAR